VWAGRRLALPHLLATILIPATVAAVVAIVLDIAVKPYVEARKECILERKRAELLLGTTARDVVLHEMRYRYTLAVSEDSSHESVRNAVNEIMATTNNHLRFRAGFILGQAIVEAKDHPDQPKAVETVKLAMMALEQPWWRRGKKRQLLTRAHERLEHRPPWKI
jgi:hypothetical protein